MSTTKMERPVFDSMSPAVDYLRSEGYVDDLKLHPEYLICNTKGECALHPDEFRIDEIFRFEGMTNPSDSSILYAISSEAHNVKGLLIDAYGVYSDTLTENMVKKLAGRN